jgi:hypothetical protein
MNDSAHETTINGCKKNEKEPNRTKQNNKRRDVQVDIHRLARLDVHALKAEQPLERESVRARTCVDAQLNTM